MAKLRRRQLLIIVVSFLFCNACAGSRRSAKAGDGASPHAQPAKKLETDSSMHTRLGATFTAPQGWYVSAGKDEIVLQDPDQLAQLVILDVENADPIKAIDSAWQRIDPKFSRTEQQTIKPPARDGWDEIVQIKYDTPHAEGTTVMALAERKGNVSYVTLLRSPHAALDRRGAQIMTVVASLKAPGQEKESFKGRTAATLDARALAEFESFAEQSRQKLNIAGAAVAITQNGHVVFQKGWGTREVGKNLPVTTKTLFMIGSTTKSLTTLMMAALVDRKLFDWNTPVTQLMPSFALGDEKSTRLLTMKHTVCACTGFPRQDLEFVFEYANVTPEQRLTMMHGMMPTTGFGETFQYSNPMVSAGGYIAAHALYPKLKLSAAYDAAMRDLIFIPLGMTSTTLDFSAAAKVEHAMPHAQDWQLDSMPIPIKNEESVISVRPAGGIWSNVEDMARYVLFELGSGIDKNGKQIISSKNLLERRKAQVKVTDDASYGLGQMVENDHGVRVVGHGGNNFGFTSDLFFLPDHNVGFVVLTNGSGSTNIYRRALRRRLLEILFSGKPEAAKGLEFSWRTTQEVTEKELKKIVFEPDAAWMDRMIGQYRNDSLGPLTIKKIGGRLVADVGEWQSAVGQKGETDGTIKMVLIDPPWIGFELLPVEKDGGVTLAIEAPQKKYVFERVKK